MEIMLNRPRTLLQWARIHRLYHEAFPRSERKPFSMIVKKWREGVMDVWYCTHAGKFVGIAITINGPTMILLDYFAIGKNLRSKGYGSAILQTLRTHYAGMGIFGEIENTYAPGPDQALRQRRKQFYLDNGLEEMGVMVVLFGVEMELLGWGCQLTYEQYHSFYRDCYSPWAAEHIQPAVHPMA